MRENFYGKSSPGEGRDEGGRIDSLSRSSLRSPLLERPFRRWNFEPGPTQTNGIHRPAKLFGHEFVGRFSEQLILFLRPVSVDHSAAVWNFQFASAGADRNLRSPQNSPNFLVRLGSQNRFFFRLPGLWSARRDAQFLPAEGDGLITAVQPRNQFLIGHGAQQLLLLVGPWPKVRTVSADANLTAPGLHREPGTTDALGDLRIRHWSTTIIIFPPLPHFKLLP